jgi:hypothetical protein
MNDELYARRMMSLGLTPVKNTEIGYKHLADRLRERFGIEFPIGRCRHLKNLMEGESGKEQLAARWVRNKVGDKEEWDVNLSTFGHDVTIRILRHAISGHIITAFKIPDRTKK